MKKILKYILILFFTIVTLLFIGFVTVSAITYKDDKIVKEDKQHIYVKKYRTAIDMSAKQRKIYVDIDSTTYKYKQKEIITEGKLIAYYHGDNHRVCVRDKHTNKFVTVDVPCSQISKLHDTNKNQQIIIIYQYYYPTEEKIIYTK